MNAKEIHQQISEVCRENIKSEGIQSIEEENIVNNDVRAFKYSHMHIYDEKYSGHFVITKDLVQQVVRKV